MSKAASFPAFSLLIAFLSLVLWRPQDAFAANAIVSKPYDACGRIDITLPKDGRLNEKQIVFSYGKQGDVARIALDCLSKRQDDVYGRYVVFDRMAKRWIVSPNMVEGRKTASGYNSAYQSPFEINSALRTANAINLRAENSKGWLMTEAPLNEKVRIFRFCLMKPSSDVALCGKTSTPYDPEAPLLDFDAALVTVLSSIRFVDATLSNDGANAREPWESEPPPPPKTPAPFCWEGCPPDVKGMLDQAQTALEAEPKTRLDALRAAEDRIEDLFLGGSSRKNALPWAMLARLYAQDFYDQLAEPGSSGPDRVSFEKADIAFRAARYLAADRTNARLAAESPGLPAQLAAEHARLIAAMAMATHREDEIWTLWGEAFSILEASVKIFPNDSQIHSALCELRTLDYLGDYRKFRDSDRGSFDTIYLYRTWTDSADMALDACQNALRLNPDDRQNPERVWTMASAAVQQASNDEARRRVTEIRDDAFVRMLKLGQPPDAMWDVLDDARLYALLQQSNTMIAANWLKTAEIMRQEASSFWRNHYRDEDDATMEELSREYDSLLTMANDSYGRALKLAPDDASIYAARARFYGLGVFPDSDDDKESDPSSLNRENLLRARADLETALRLSPRNTLYQDGLTYVNDALSKLDEKPGMQTP